MHPGEPEAKAGEQSPTGARSADKADAVQSESVREPRCQEESTEDHLVELLIPRLPSGLRRLEVCDTLLVQTKCLLPVSSCSVRGTQFMDHGFVGELPLLVRPWAREGVEESKEDGADRCDNIPFPPEAKAECKVDEDKGVLGLVPRRYAPEGDSDDDDAKGEAKGGLKDEAKGQDSKDSKGVSVRFGDFKMRSPSRTQRRSLSPLYRTHDRYAEDKPSAPRYEAKY